MLDTLKGLASILEAFPSSSRIIVWLNEYFAPFAAPKLRQSQNWAHSKSGGRIERRLTRKHFIDPGEFLSRLAFRSPPIDFCQIEYRPVLIIEDLNVMLLQQRAQRPSTSFFLIAAFRKIREKARNRFYTIGTVGADDAGRSALEPSGDVQARQRRPVEHSAAHVRHRAEGRIEWQAGNRNAAVTDAAKDETTGQFEGLTGGPCNLGEWRAFQVVACQN